MPKGNHSKSNFLNVKALSDSESKQVLKSDLSNVAELVIFDGVERFKKIPLKNVDKNLLQSTEYRQLKDRSFNIATLKHQQPGSMRIRTVSEDGSTISVLTLKESEVNAGITDSIRVRSILKKNEYSLPYSEWVNYDFIGKQMASSFNQYRIQGWTESFVKSHWVYSNVRNEHNEEILFRLLHDFLDVTLNAYDDQIDIVTDFMLGDKIIMLIKEHAPEMYNALDLNDKLKYRLSEILEITGSFIPSTIEEEMVTHLLEVFNIQSSKFNKVIEEYFYTSIEEFSILMQSYKIQDELNFSIYDKEALAEVMVKLEDIYEEIVNRSNIEVFLSNKSNSSIFIESFFKLDIKAENIRHYFDMSFSDSVVSTIQSAVQLLVSSDINDLADAVIYDRPYTEFISYIEDVLPIYRLLEEAQALVLTYAKDRFKMDINENPLQYVLFDESGFFSYELAYEVFSFIGEDLLDLHINADFQDLYKHVFKEKSLFMIDRLLEELYKFSVEDEFELMNSKEKLDYIKEVYQARILQDFDIAMNKILTSSAEDYTIDRIEDALIMSSILYYDYYDLECLGYSFNIERYKAGKEIGLVQEDKPMKLSESFVSDFSNKITKNEENKIIHLLEGLSSTFKKNKSEIKENKTTHFLEALSSIFKKNSYEVDENKTIKLSEKLIPAFNNKLLVIEENKDVRFLEILSLAFDHKILTEESKIILIKEYASKTDIQDFFNFKESKTVKREEKVHRLIKILIRESIPSTLPEKMIYKYLISLEDNYIIDGKEKIQYGLIDKEGDHPIGKFIIGADTLIGEENF